MGNVQVFEEGEVKMNIRHRALALLLGVLVGALAPLSISAATNSSAARPTRLAPAALASFAGGVTVPVSGTTSKGGKFTGDFAIKEFKVVGDQIVAVGTLTGTVQNGV